MPRIPLDFQLFDENRDMIIKCDIIIVNKRNAHGVNAAEFLVRGLEDFGLTSHFEWIGLHVELGQLGNLEQLEFANLLCG
jgi:hypothetical protein